MLITGIWSDRLRSDEVEFSQKIAEYFAEKDEYKSLIQDSKIQKVLNSLKSPKSMSEEDIKAAKSHLFEIRFSYAIDQLGLDIIYEHKTGVDNTSVDFLIKDKEQHEWLVELTSLRDGEHIKQDTNLNEGMYSYISPDNNAEVKDIHRAQQAILCKVAKNGDTPIKFPETNTGCKKYNIIIVDMRAINFGMVDNWDLQAIMFGCKHLNEYYREFIDKEGKAHPIMGICDLDYSDLRAKYFRERVHAVGFINEKEYKEGEISTQLKVYYNNLMSTDSVPEFPIGTNPQFLRKP